MNKNTTFYLIGFATFICLIAALVLVAFSFLLASDNNVPTSNIEPIQTTAYQTALAEVQAQPTQPLPTLYPTQVFVTPIPTTSQEEFCYYKITSVDTSSFYVVIGLYGEGAQIICDSMVSTNTDANVYIQHSASFSDTPTCTGNMEHIRFEVYSPIVEFAETFCEAAR